MSSHSKKTKRRYCAPFGFLFGLKQTKLSAYRYLWLFIFTSPSFSCWQYFFQTVIIGLCNCLATYSVKYEKIKAWILEKVVQKSRFKFEAAFKI